MLCSWCYYSPQQMVSWLCQKHLKKLQYQHVEVRTTNCVVATQALNLLVHVTEKVTVVQNSCNHFTSLFPWSSMVSNAKGKVRLPFFLQFHPGKVKQPKSKGAIIKIGRKWDSPNHHQVNTTFPSCEFLGGVLCVSLESVILLPAHFTSIHLLWQIQIHALLHE